MIKERERERERNRADKFQQQAQSSLHSNSIVVHRGIVSYCFACSFIQSVSYFIVSNHIEYIYTHSK